MRTHAPASQASLFDLTARQAVMIAVPLLAVICVTRIHAPVSWPVTHYLFTYEFGFQRRSLLGSLLATIWPQGLTLAMAEAIALGLTLAAAAALAVWIGRRVLSVPGGPILFLLFLSSPGLAATLGNTGYLDMVLILLTVAVLSLPATTVGAIGAAALCGAGTLVHEAMLPAFAPLIFAKFWLQASKAPMARRVTLATLPLAAGIAGAAFAVLAGTQPAALYPDLVQAAADRSLDYNPVRAAVATLAELPLAHPDNSQSEFGHPAHLFELRTAGVVVLILIAAMIRLPLAALADRPALDRVVGIAAALAPLSLLAVAFDVPRFLALALVNLYLVTALAMARPGAPDIRPALSPVFVICLLLAQANIMLRDFSYRQEDFTAGFPGVFLTFSEWSLF